MGRVYNFSAGPSMLPLEVLGLSGIRHVGNGDEPSLESI